MKLGRRSAIVLMLFVLNAAASADDSCNYATLPGREFQFRETDESMSKYRADSLMGWRKEPKRFKETLNHKDYAGKKGKIQEIQANPLGGFDSWYVAVLETCEKIYSFVISPDRPLELNVSESSTGIYFLDILRQAESMIGKKIWANQNYAREDRGLFTDDSKLEHPLGHIEILEVVGVTTKMIDHVHKREVGPYFLVVRKKTGDTGYLAFYDSNFFLKNPIDPKWDKATVEMIKQRKIKLGMSEQQLSLSWGRPQRINRSVGSFGVHEQWIYGSGQYVYMQNGKLTSFQSSR